MRYNTEQIDRTRHDDPDDLSHSDAPSMEYAGTGQHETGQHETEYTGTGYTESSDPDASDRTAVADPDAGPEAQPELDPDNRADQADQTDPDDETALDDGYPGQSADQAVTAEHQDPTAEYPDQETEDAAASSETADAGETAETSETVGTEPVGTETVEASEPVVVGMMPGDGSEQASSVEVLLPADQVDSLRERWQQVQLRFIDNPEGTAREAQTLVSEAVDALTASLSQQRDSLNQPVDGTADTEVHRAAVMRHRDFLDRLLSLS